MDERAAGSVRRCKGVTRAGKPCRRPAAENGFCRQHDAASFYARALSAGDRAAFDAAMAQEGLAGEVAVLRLHLLHLLQRAEPAAAAEIPRTVHALVRALKDGRAAADGVAEALDAAIRDEGRRWLRSAAESHEGGREE
jgi:hypothetical protein